MDSVLNGSLTKSARLIGSMNPISILKGTITTNVKLSGKISASTQKPVSYHEVRNEFGGDTVIIGG